MRVVVVAIATLAAIRIVPQLEAEAWVMTMALAVTRPAVTGTSPACTVRAPGSVLEALPQPQRKAGDQRRRPELGERGHQHAGEARDMPADQRHHHHVRPRRGLRQREQRAEFLRRHPVMDVDHLTLHLGQDGVAAAEGEQRQFG